jgi:ubiquinone/menaquinone biosynthesis C-methylase UbiE
MKVLDVGCGPGSIALDVAESISPGQLIGIDPMSIYIEQATQLARERDVRNALFQVGDTYNIEFADDSFDIAYSNTVMHGVIDPVKALIEQRRVVKKDGWVVAAGVRDLGLSPRYPECPMLERVYQAWIRYHEFLHAQYQSGKNPLENRDLRHGETGYLDLQGGRKCPEWFSRAGFEDIDIKLRVFKTEFPGAEGMEVSLQDGLPSLDEGSHFVVERYEAILAEGFLDRETYEKARQELIAWYKNPHAFHFYAFVCAAGRA